MTRYGGDHTQGPACATAVGSDCPRCRGHRCARRRTTPRFAGVLFGATGRVRKRSAVGVGAVCATRVGGDVWATLLAAVEQSLAGRSNIVLLTRVGGGVFGNADAWIDDAIVRARPGRGCTGWAAVPVASDTERRWNGQRWPPTRYPRLVGAPGRPAGESGPTPAKPAKDRRHDAGATTWTDDS